MRLPNRGFTLIEMIISIVLLAVIGLSLSAIIQHSMTIYTGTTDREELILQGRFVTERMHKEIRDAVPNSVQVNSTETCIEWLPTVNTAVYETLAITPEKSNIVRVLPERGIKLGDRLVVMPTSATELLSPLPTSGLGRIAQAAQDIDFTAGNDAEMVDITLTQPTSFEENSPAHRLYMYRKPLGYCVEGSQLFRYSDYPLSRPELSPSGLSTGKRQLMANNIKDASFNVEHPSLVRNGLVKLQFIFSDNNEEVRLDHDVLIFNTP
jgi:MSHA biogenesis protein MshO